ncbi:hypothetical protein WJX74_001494 [Apatococcus lobatus]|uniref:Secreted protein n=1 Tax=Apatococcus lobatus TaxID=904363 RepID=A0AAW1RAS2_9CHLO
MRTELDTLRVVNMAIGIAAPAPSAWAHCWLSLARLPIILNKRQSGLWMVCMLLRVELLTVELGMHNSEGRYPSNYFGAPPGM